MIFRTVIKNESKKKFSADDHVGKPLAGKFLGEIVGARLLENNDIELKIKLEDNDTNASLLDGKSNSFSMSLKSTTKEDLL